MTSKDGFSVVAPIRVTVPSSTWGSTASCCALFQRCSSSMKRTVRWPSLRAWRASAITRRMSATPEVTALRDTWRAPAAALIRWARVVLPLPGGPQSTRLGRPPDSARPRSTATALP